MVQQNLFTGQEQREWTCGHGVGRMNWEIGIDIGAVPCVK